MKKIFIAAYLFLLADYCNAQTKHADSLKTGLAKTSNPMERFDIIRNDLELINVSKADKVDSASCIQLLKIAQDLKNDSLLAISYNWIGSYFSPNWRKYKSQSFVRSYLCPYLNFKRLLLVFPTINYNLFILFSYK